MRFIRKGISTRAQTRFKRVLRGDSEVTAVVSPHWIGISPKLSVFELPYAFPNRDAIYAAISNEEFLGKAFDEVESKGATLLGIFVYDYALLCELRQAACAACRFR